MPCMDGDNCTLLDMQESKAVLEAIDQTGHQIERFPPPAV